uniref:Uncharacterized protein n=1 Tax=Meloidogyne incognita TaxID=6306 RepID=A0A914MJR2_MELIC
MQRICVQVEELFKKKLKKSEKALSETSSIDCEVHVSTRGRKPKQQLNDETMTKHRRSAGMSEKPKEHEDLALQLNKFYNNVMRKRTKARHNNELPIEHEEKQCIGPECTNSVRQGSKYCSERCGLALAQVSDFDIFGVRFTIRVLFLSELRPCFSFSCLKTSKATDFFKEFQNQGLLSKNGRREGTFPQIFQTKFFNFQIRLKTILPQRFNDFFCQSSFKTNRRQQKTR